MHQLQQEKNPELETRSKLSYVCCHGVRQTLNLPFVSAVTSQNALVPDLSGTCWSHFIMYVRRMCFTGSVLWMLGIQTCGD